MPRRGENIRKRKDGRWEGRYISAYTLDGKAQYVSVYAKSYCDIKKKMQEIYKDKMINLSAANKDICFREVLFLWLTNCKIKLRIQTHSKYLEIIENHIIPELGSIRVSRLNAYIINSFLEKKSAEGRLDGKGGLSATYIKMIAYVIQASIDFASQEELMKPLNTTINKPSKKQYELPVLTVNEQMILEKHLRKDIDDAKLGILICLNIGLRVGEICGLMWKDIDYENGTVHICRTVTRIKNPERKAGTPKTNLILGEPKTISSDRIIPVPSHIMPLIKLVHEHSLSEYVVSGNTNSFLDPRTYQYRFHRYLEKSNLGRVNFHALRHTFATRCIEVGMDIKSLSEFLGHASVNITLDTYVHSSMDLKRRQIEMLDSFRGQ